MVTLGRLNSAARRVYVAAQSIPVIKSIFIQGEKKNAALNSILGFSSKVDRLQYLAEHSEGTLKASVRAELIKLEGSKLLSVPLLVPPRIIPAAEESVNILLEGMPEGSVEAKSIHRVTPGGKLGGEHSGALALAGLDPADKPKDPPKSGDQ